jgi:AraC-like DNA-binding protein
MISNFTVEILAIVLVWQSLIFAALFMGIHYNTDNYPKKFIAWFMLANAGYFGITWLAYFGHTPELRYVYPLAMPLLLCHLPVFYWYIRALTGVGFRVEGKQWLHLLPALIVLLLQMAFFLMPDNQATRFLENGPLMGQYANMQNFLIGMNRVSFYGILTFQFLYYIMKYRRVLRVHRNSIENVFSYTENIDLKWLHTLMIGILLFFVGNDLTYIIGLNYHSFSALFFSMGMIAINFYIGYHSLVQRQVIHKVYAKGIARKVSSPAEEVQQESDRHTSADDSESTRYKRSSLKTDVRAKIIHRLDRIMQEEELFTDTKLSIDDVAQRLGINSKYLSQSINEAYNRNFYIYVNELRVEKAKSYLLVESHANYSIEGIARQVGFQSKSSFYIAFKRITGLTPSAFRDMIVENAGKEPGNKMHEELAAPS